MGVKAALESSENERRTINSQCIDEVMAVSRGIPRSMTQVTGGIDWCLPQKKTDKGGGGWFPTVRHDNLIGQVQVERRKVRRRLRLDRGNTIVAPSVKKKTEGASGSVECLTNRVPSGLSSTG